MALHVLTVSACETCNEAEQILQTSIDQDVVKLLFCARGLSFGPQLDSCASSDILCAQNTQEAERILQMALKRDADPPLS